MKKLLIYLAFILIFLVACQGEQSLEAKVEKINQELKNYVNSDTSFADFIKNCPVAMADGLAETLKKKYIVDNSPFMFVAEDEMRLTFTTLGDYEAMDAEQKAEVKEQIRNNETEVYGKMNYLPTENSGAIQTGDTYRVVIRQMIEVDKLHIKDMPNMSIEKPLTLVISRMYSFELKDNEYIWTDFDMQTSMQ